MLQIEGYGVAYSFHLAKPIQKRVLFCPAPSLFLSFPARFQLFHTFYSTGSGLLSGPQLSGSELRISSRAFDLVYSQH